MIRLLSKETIDKIAAGEVVDRPENVARELLDNAIDSGATAVSVEIREGGIGLIRVTDNGCGIEKSDLPYAFTRHATSKLENAEDLTRITTMGFRGEALASIAGVSRVELITKRKEDITGTRYVIEGGTELSVRDVGVPCGTTVLVRDLFYNVPVRRRFLKSMKTEASFVRDIVEKAALSFPEISFSFLNDGKQMFHTSGNGKLQDVIYTIYGSETVSHLIPVSFSEDLFSVSGFISAPSMARTRRDSEICFVNGRFVKSPVIERAVETAYEGYLMQHRFPFTVLKIGIGPEKIDVNIHPKKTEIRFSDDEKVFDLIYNCVKNTLRRRENIEDVLHREEKKTPEIQKHLEPFENRGCVYPESSAGQLAQLRDQVTDIYHSIPDQVSRQSGTGGSRYRQNEARLPGKTAAENAAVPPVNEDPGPCRQVSAEPSFEQLRFIDPDAEAEYKFIGQIFETYWLIEYNSSLYIVDQHAAHEKVNFERLMAQITTGTAESQLILPILLTLPAKDAALLDDHLDEFANIGFQIESAGDHDYYVRAVPASLPSISEKDLLMELIGGLAEIRPGIKETVLGEKIASMSCKAAVKGNRRLTEPEIRALIGELLKCRDPYNCPHGRPVMIRFSKTELDRMFKRIV